MYNYDNPLGGLSSLGVLGLIIVLVFWAIVTLITGYIFGLGVWASAPRSLKRLLEDEYKTRFGETPAEEIRRSSPGM